MVNHQSGILFGKKAETLEALRPQINNYQIPDFIFFSVAQWQSQQQNCLDRISELGKTPLIVRSSAADEDGVESTNAGAFLSIPNLELSDSPGLMQAINRVIASFPDHPENQVLVQNMVQNIAVSGVITTRDLRDGGPYYVINYDDESGRTDSITNGSRVSKTLRIFRDSDFSQIVSARVRQWLEMALQLEQICLSDQLDIEFGQDQQGQLFLFQVRRLVHRHWDRDVMDRVAMAHQHVKRFFQERSARKDGVLGNRTILGIMPDWNPAEIIGVTPSPLACSLYRYLITDQVWRMARAQLGYFEPVHQKLMVSIGGRPFIDVRNSFNSFLPADLRPELGELLVNAWLNRLDQFPELHDKVEFAVATTAMDFSFDRIYQERYPELLKQEDLQHYRACLSHLTQRCLNPNFAFQPAMRLIRELPTLSPFRAHHPNDWLYRAEGLLRLCRDRGTLPFSIVARLAFIAEGLLRSALERAALLPERLAQFKRSLRTVLHHLNSSYTQATKGPNTRAQFLAEYGHLRPGTYDICSPRYDLRQDLFLGASPLNSSSESVEPFELSAGEHRNFERLLAESDLEVEPDALFQFAKRAIEGREKAKFEFSRLLSAALECFANWGEELGFERADIALLEIDDLLRPLSNPILEPPDAWYRRTIDKARKDMAFCHGLRLGYLIRGAHDIDIIPVHRAQPNFITANRVVASPLFISGQSLFSDSLVGKIVCIENADPGFDWIFTRGIAGLITQFGGTNSHMAIRCAELGIPAAIGCGEVLFNRVRQGQVVELDCHTFEVRVLNPQETAL